MKRTTGILALMFVGISSSNAGAAPQAGGLAFDQIQYALGAKQPRPTASNFATDYRLAQTPGTNVNPSRGGPDATAQTVEMASTLASNLAGAGGANVSGLTGLGAHIGAGLFARHAESQARSAAPDASAAHAGTLVRFAFNAQGWERIETPQNHQVVIFKPELREEIVLDTEAKTWREQTVDDATTANGGPIAGTATSAYAEKSATIPAVAVDGRPAAGAQSTVSITATGAKGACRNGRFDILDTSYVSNLAIPAALARYEALHELSLQPGCVPTVTGPLPSVNHLAVFRIVDVNGGITENLSPADPTSALLAKMRADAYGPAGYARGSKTAPSTIVTERGNLRQLGPNDAGLFEVPADYART